MAKQISLSEARKRGAAAKAAKAVKAAQPKKPKPPRKANAQSGAGNGQGRKPGEATKKTREIANKIASDGEETPLEYMLRVMRQRDDDLDQLVKDKALDAADALKLKAARSERRDWAAEKAAPYIHPRLQSIDMKADVKTELKNLSDEDLEERIGRLITEAGIAAAATGA